MPIVPILAALMVVVSACYRPNIGPWLRCAPLPEKRCPDGYSCDVSSDTCRRPSDIDAAPDLPPPDLGNEGHGDGSNPPSDGAADVPPQCIQPRAGCAPQNAGGLCDPFCLSGCACDQRCVVTAAGALTCTRPLLPGNLPVGASCDIASGGTLSQTDACAPGSVCLADGCGKHCFRYCRADADCPESDCTRPATTAAGNPGGFKVCEVPFMTCDPVNPSASGCPHITQTCYLSTVMPDKTFCDCPNGDQRESQPCESTHDCFVGLTCIDPGNTGDLRCRATCGMAEPTPCGGAATCRPINGSKVFGFCL